MPPQTMFEKIWNDHLVLSEENESLLYADRILVHEEVHHSIGMLGARNLPVHRPQQVFAFTDHYVPTTGQSNGIEGIANPEYRNMVSRLTLQMQQHGIRLFGMDDPAQGILHIVPPEQGITQPGLVLVGIDSHTSTHGAFGCLAHGIGFSEVAHALATQTLWQRRPRAMRVWVDGKLDAGVSAKDIVLAIIAEVGAGGGAGYVVEYAGSAIANLSMEGRMTVCNMSIEFGAKAGMIAPDDITFDYMRGRRYAPAGAKWNEAMACWRTLPTDAGAAFDKEVTLQAASISPMVTWGTSPEHASPVTSLVPDPQSAKTDAAAAEIAAALDYMGLQAGMSLQDIQLDRVFIGSCTNSRIEDLRAAAAIASQGRAKIPAWVVPGSRTVKRQAEQEGLDQIFIRAGFEWRDPGCSLCTAINGDQLQPGERCASTSNRNFRGRQGTGSRTHLLSPAMAAAAALAGHITDVREMIR